MVANMDGDTALYKAASVSREAEVRLLLEKGADIMAMDKHGNTALHIAAGGWHEAPEVVQLLLKKGADIMAVNMDRDTALHLAASNGHEAVVRMLLDKVADMSMYEDGDMALHLAASIGHEEVVQRLLENPSLCLFSERPRTTRN
jgi:ankyrin repeat protein